MRFPFTSLFALATLSSATPLPQVSKDVELGACKSTTFICARGTTETGNMGITVCPSLASNLKIMLGANNVAVQGVNYAADTTGAVMSSFTTAQVEGSKNMAALTKQALGKCPTTKVVLAGYSQGAQQVHGALMNLGAVGGKVAAAVTFGDPLSKQAFQNIDKSKTRIFCQNGDTVCNNIFILTAAHFAYTIQDTQTAAKWIVERVK